MKMRHYVWASVMLLSACATPSERFADAADNLGFEELTVRTDRFAHRIYSHINAVKNTDRKTLHIYLDGDGTPWQQRWIAGDPTSRSPIILKLMEQDSEPSILLGRPCYHGFSDTEPCHNKFWTSHRYSKPVVESMAAALQQWLEATDFNEIVLIGYSGGGTLAMLIAPYIDKIKAIVTVAANLDVKAWSEFHGYLPISGSLNPAVEPELPPMIRQFHLAGGKDDNVPPFIIETFAKTHRRAQAIIYSDFDHQCCWAEAWPSILGKIQAGNVAFNAGDSR
jgi:dienelactone hydrolase